MKNMMMSLFFYTKMCGSLAVFCSDKERKTHNQAVRSSVSKIPFSLERAMSKLKNDLKLLCKV